MIEELENIGFDEKEAKIYLALLRVGKGTANQIMLKTNIERRTIYDVLERLIQKGYARYYKENKTTIYVPTEPQSILKNIEDKKESFKKIIPNLSRLKEKEQAVEVEIIKGKESIRNMYSEIIDSAKQHYSFGNLHVVNETMGFELKKALSKIESIKGKEKVIYPAGQKMLKISNGEYRELNPKLMPPTPVTIYGDYTCFFILGDSPLVIKIKNKELAKTHLAYFETYWKQSKPVKNKK